MPISAEQWSRYPDDWAEISFRIKNRAGWRCECHGECGRVGAHLEPVDGRCRNRHGEPRWRGKWWQTPVYLATAHLNGVPEDVTEDNLIALCEACHLQLDQRQHIAARRLRWEVERGLVPLFEVV